jgi:AcrR family transcriptional regulator
VATARPTAALGGGETRERILVAALRAFSEKGFDGASTREIATLAGVNPGLLPYYFGGKLRLWQSAVDRAFGELRVALDAGTGDPGVVEDRERTRRLARAYVRFVARHPEFVRLMHDEGKRRGPRMRWIVDRHVRPLYAVFEALIRRSQAAGLLPADIDPIHFFYILAGSVGLIFHQAEECKRLAGIDPADEAAIEAHARAVEFVLVGRSDEETSR